MDELELVVEAVEEVELEVEELPNHKVSSSNNKGSSSKYNFPPRLVTVVVVELEVEEVVVELELLVVD